MSERVCSAERRAVAGEASGEASGGARTEYHALMLRNPSLKRAASASLRYGRCGKLQ